jgi:vitamin B12 transporter
MIMLQYISYRSGSGVFLVLAVLAVVGLSSSLLAQDDVSEMETVEVSARSIEGQVSAELSQYGHSVEVITERDINRGGYQTLEGVLKGEVSGLYVGSGSGQYTSLSLNGSGDGDLLVLVDGVRLNNRLYGTPYLDSLNPHMIKRIEVLDGGQSLFYGTEAIKGAINIILKKPTKTTDGEFGVGGGSFSRREVFGNVSKSIDEDGDHTFLVFGNSVAADGFQPYPSEDYDTPVTQNVGRQHRGFNRENLGFKYRYNISSGESLKLFSSYNRARIPHSRINREIQDVNNRNEIISTLKYEKRVSDEFAYFVKAYYHDWTTKFTKLEANDTGNIKNNYTNQDDVWTYEDYGINAMGKYRGTGWNQWVFGVDYQRYGGKDDVLVIEQRTEEVYAPYAQWRPELSFSPNTNLAIGGRYNVPSGEGDKGIWNVSMKHFFENGLYLRGVTGTSFRLPNAYQLGADESFAQGNPNLEPEESFNVNVGVGGNAELAGTIVTWDVGLFQTEIDNLITTDPSATPTNLFMNAEGQTNIDGYQAKLNFRPIESVQSKLSYTVSDAQTQGSNQQLEGRPESIGKATFSWTSPQGRYGADLISQYVGDVYQRETFGGSQETLNYGNYALVDLAFQYHTGPQQNESFSFRLGNVFDENYYSSVSSGNYVGGSNPDHFLRHRGTPRNLQVRYTHNF